MGLRIFNYIVRINADEESRLQIKIRLLAILLHAKKSFFTISDKAQPCSAKGYAIDLHREKETKHNFYTLCKGLYYDGEYLDQAYSADFVGLRRFNYIGEPRQARKHVLRSLITKWDTLHRYLRRLAKTEDPKYKFNLALERWKMAPSEANKTRVFEALFSKRIKTLQKLVTDYFSWPDEESLAKIEGYRRRRGFSKALITILASEWRETASGLHDMASSDEAKEFYKSLSDPNAITLHKPQSATMETE
ncbi:hypothetical protein L596_029616 [Steinernema carpocapsae]|uniref:Uncharacterized protein n=1 Tax=Steinernema carpocapsae TaxID=34508 RepID=A0A4U5LV60_STECR|nr:hypothetical protein L596_029616 [Steinernema carpocapsae]